MIEYIILFLCFSLLVGSWAYIKPSPRQRHQSDVRMQAIKAGLKIKQESIDDTTVAGRVNSLKTTVMTYQLLLPVEKKSSVRLCVQRTSGEHDYALPDGWVWVKKTDQTAISTYLFEQLKTLPTHFDLVRFEEDFVSVAWNEKGNELVDLHARLNQWANHLLTL